MVLPQGQAGGVNGAEGIFVFRRELKSCERAKPFFSSYFITIFDGHGEKTSRRLTVTNRHFQTKRRLNHCYRPLQHLQYPGKHLHAQ